MGHSEGNVLHKKKLSTQHSVRMLEVTSSYISEHFPSANKNANVINPMIMIHNGKVLADLESISGCVDNTCTRTKSWYHARWYCS